MIKKISSNTTLKRIPELDGLRGIAILLVISFHYINNQLFHSENIIGKALGKATSFGWVGVDLFFILSGFLIGTVLIRSKNSKNYFSTFYIRRIVRIIPNYFLLIIIFLILTAIPYFSSNYFLTGNNILPAWSYFAMMHNIYMALQNNMGNVAMSVTWSIGIEEQFYIIFPFIVYFLKDKWLPFLMTACIVLAIIFRMQFHNWIPPYVLLHCRMDAISFGVLVAWFNYHYDLKEAVDKFYKPLILIMVLDILICAFLYYKYADLGNIRNTLFGIFFSISLVIALTRSNSLYAAFLRNNILRWVGSISYSLYLFHYMILGILHHLFGNTNGIGIANLKDVIITVLALISSLLFSYFLFRRLETPMVNFGKRYKY